MTWFPSSRLLLVSLFSWNVCCFPAKKGWSLYDPHEGSFSNVATPPRVRHHTSQRFPAQPTDVNHPAVSYLHEPAEKEVFSAPVANPVTDNEVDHRESRASDLPSFTFQAGELEHYEENVEHGDVESETEELNFAPPPPLPPYPGPQYQAGELSHYESVYEHGNEERETEERGLAPPPPSSPYEEPTTTLTSETDDNFHPVPPELGFRHQYYLFLSGQLPPGTFSHYLSDYETGRDHWDEVHYKRYHFPVAQNPDQNQEDPGDELWQQHQETQLYAAP